MSDEFELVFEKYSTPHPRFLAQERHTRHSDLSYTLRILTYKNYYWPNVSINLVYGKIWNHRYFLRTHSIKYAKMPIVYDKLLIMNYIIVTM